MFSRDKWKEIFLTIQHHKLRTFLTGFGVFWGIFMLLILLGAGNGLEKGISQQFKGYAFNSFFVWSSKTALPYKSMNAGRYVRLTNSDVQLIQENIQGIENLNASTILQGEFEVNYASKSGSFSIIGNLPDLIMIENITIVKGRFLNTLDCQNKRKVAVIGHQVEKILFGSDNYNPIGKDISINGVFFKVIGIFNKTDNSGGSRDPTARIHVPLTALQQTFGLENQIHWISVRMQNDIVVQEAEQKTVDLLKKHHVVSPKDKRGIGSWNTVEKFNRARNLFKGIKIFIWIVGIGTITAGIVGVNNIMLIIVNERTREIGIRKAIGATPISIITLILQESVTITLLAGYIGLIAGVCMIESVGYFMEKFRIQSEFFKTPEINFKAAIFALSLLVLTGIIAGLMPAYRAASINPIKALRNE